MSKVLMVGCSFLSNFNCDNSKIKIIGKGGAGNQLIAATVMHELSTSQYDEVYVIWSGVNRLDMPVGINLHNTLGDTYSFCQPLGDVVWYSSGGIHASGSQPTCPSDIRNLFHLQYVGATPRYLTDQTLTSLIAVQSTLTSKLIPYRMAFTYNIDNKIYDNNWLENILGTLDRSSPLNALVDWTKIQTTDTPYEWCKDRNLLLHDNFHPDYNGMICWILENFKIDITKLVDL